jgi:hypothetical protein
VSANAPVTRASSGLLPDSGLIGLVLRCVPAESWCRKPHTAKMGWLCPFSSNHDGRYREGLVISMQPTDRPIEWDAHVEKSITSYSCMLLMQINSQGERMVRSAFPGVEVGRKLGAHASSRSWLIPGAPHSSLAVSSVFQLLLVRCAALWLECITFSFGIRWAGKGDINSIKLKWKLRIIYPCYILLTLTGAM